MTLAMASTGFAIVDTAAMCLGITGVAMVFGAFAAVTAQLWRQARTASGAAMATLAVAALVRGAGDVIDNSGSVLSWFSPIAWAHSRCGRSPTCAGGRSVCWSSWPSR